MFVKLRYIAIAAAVISGVGGSDRLVAACPSTTIAYQVSGRFGSTAISGADKLKLAGGPFSVTLYGCETMAPTKTGSDYAEYTGLLLTGEVKSYLLDAPTHIRTDETSILLVQQPVGLDSIQLSGSVKIEGGTINIFGDVAIPSGTLSSTSIAPFPSVSVVTANSEFVYSQGANSTTLAVIGTVAASVYTPPGGKSSPFLHAAAVRVITAHADGTQITRALEAAPVDPAGPGDRVMLQFYASGVRDASEVHMQIAGQEAPVLYFGAAGHFPGLDEVTVEVPHSLTGIGDVEVGLTADGQAASPVHIHIQ
ncbi:MAG TPA: hypothetical protein VN924_29820 [Bryobacteraceae bacterium]|nr:hypothetical protein [Bryobacteraceae bacterium]